MILNNIMIFDDDNEDRTIFCDAIKAVLPDANCMEAAGVEEALRSLRGDAVSPDFIFLDFYMQGRR